jgi:hypothetical protein
VRGKGFSRTVHREHRGREGRKMTE